MGEPAGGWLGMDRTGKSVLTLDDIGTIFAAQAILGSGAMRNAKTVPQQAVAVLSTYNAPNNAQTIFNNTVGGPNGTKLASVSIAVDAVFQANYYWLLQITSVMDSSTGATWQPWDPTDNVFDAVPNSRTFLVPNGAVVKIQAYNAVPTNSLDGHMSVYVAYGHLSTAERAVLDRYAGVLNRIAGMKGASASFI